MTRALVTKMLRALDASRDDVNECLNEVLPKAGSYRYDRVIDSLTAKLTKHDAAITAARDYLATEPSGERAELIAALRSDFNDDRTDFDNIKYAADMLEADAQQAKQVPMTEDEIENWYASENGLEECNMSYYPDFEKVVRAVENRCGIGCEV